MMVLPVYNRDLDRGPGQRFRGFQAGEAAANDQHSMYVRLLRRTNRREARVALRIAQTGGQGGASIM